MGVDNQSSCFDESIASFLKNRGVTRLVHFTPSRNLLPIISSGELRPASDLNEEVATVHAHTDPNRFDGHLDKISFSLEYPNPYYFRIARTKTNALNYPEWSIVLMEPSIATKLGTVFSPANAALASGKNLEGGIRGITTCYSSPESSSGRVIYRGPYHLPASPTNLQAEVLVPGPVPLSDVQCIVLPSPVAVAQEFVRLRRFGVDPESVKWATSSALFDVEQVRHAVQNSQSINIVPWNADEEDES